MLSAISQNLLKRVTSTRLKKPNNALYGYRQTNHSKIYFASNKLSSITVLCSRNSYSTSRIKSSPKVNSVKITGKDSRSRVIENALRRSIRPKSSRLLISKRPGIKSFKKSAKPRGNYLTPQKKLRLKIRELRRRALQPPKPLPRTARSVYMAQHLTGTGSNTKTVLSDASSKWKSVSSAELEQYRKTAAQNKATNFATLNAWLSHYTPDQIRIANNARRVLNRKYGRKIPLARIQDPRLPKRPLGVYVCFVKERFDSGQLVGVPFLTASKMLASEFHALAPAHRKKLEDTARIHRQRYIQEFKIAFKRDSRAKA
ncbi:BgtA-21001 [Blumeria graminis f. sp. tritici]|uniref:BgtA-21001 n=2 Tax=Blumeria graminis f. sp. tritici TaxID=62690 RepID=A0A9X9QED5_BLUGR|nr:hypothetical protein BGT96224_A21001 [Blumeria graminis f. sp. tritici 96224]VDB90593.1 BgtA-21001 [Blumeria graminis f. sp. tritici]